MPALNTQLMGTVELDCAPAVLKYLRVGFDRTRLASFDPFFRSWVPGERNVSTQMASCCYCFQATLLQTY